jgi:hypothetical protein
MSSIPNRPISTASSVASLTSNQNSSSSNKKVPVKQNKPVAGGGGGGKASSINDVSEISTPTQQNPNGPPTSFQPKPQLSRAERRAVQVINIMFQTSLILNFSFIFPGSSKSCKTTKSKTRHTYS